MSPVPKPHPHPPRAHLQRKLSTSAANTLQLGSPHKANLNRVASCISQHTDSPQGVCVCVCVRLRRLVRTTLLQCSGLTWARKADRLVHRHWYSVRQLVKGEEGMCGRTHEQRVVLVYVP